MTGAACELKFQNETIIRIAFGQNNNKVKIKKGSDTECYEIIKGLTVEPSEFFESLSEPIKILQLGSPLPRVEAPEYEKIETPIVDGKIAIEDKKLVCAILKTDNFVVKKRHTLLQ